MKHILAMLLLALMGASGALAQIYVARARGMDGPGEHAGNG